MSGTSPSPKKSLHHFSCGTFKPLLYKVPLVTWVTKFAKTISQGGMIEPPDTKKMTEFYSFETQ